VRRIAVLAVLVAGTVCASASATTAPTSTIRIDVALSAQRVTLSQSAIRRGYYAQFRVRNRTAAYRTFTIAGRSIRVPAKKVRLVVVDFLVRGRYPYASRGPQSVARGVFRVS
jgi:hypothetical protein